MKKIILKFCKLGILLSLLLCSRTIADAFEPQILTDVAMNKNAGRGNFIFVTLRLKIGEELSFMVDTGAPGTLLDKSLESKLGRRLGRQTIEMLGGSQKAGIYKTPNLYVGGILLMTGSNVATVDFRRLSAQTGHPIMGILGMDCLKNYCLQLDFTAGKLRFLHTNLLDAGELGKAFSLVTSENPEDTKPVISQAGLLGGTSSNSIIDTGCNIDCLTEAGAIKRHASRSYSGGFITRVKHFLAVEGVVNKAVSLPECVWDGNTYTNIIAGRAPSDSPSWIGLRFLARHLVTFDFPNRTMYLKQVSTGPLTDKKTE